MCDTLFATGSMTSSGNLIFGKNSDREPLEAQEIRHFHRSNPRKSELACTYISIPQVERTWEVWLSKPFQMWGAEMGVNEWGLTIGNEAVFTLIKFDKSKPGLTGMDLLRLALERCKTAMEAKDHILELLSEYGQNGCGGFQNKDFFYHNSFLIADLSESLILETAGKSWAWKKVKDHASISNCLTLDEDYDEIHLENEDAHFASLFRPKKGFKSRFSDFIFTYFSKAKIRKSTTATALNAKKGVIGVLDVIKILQTHNRPDTKFNPKKATASSVCMHATSITNPSETTGSMIAEIRPGQSATVWLSGTPHPCLSLYVPHYFGMKSEHLTFPSSQKDRSLWWQAHELHLLIEKKWEVFAPPIREELNQIQAHWIQTDTALLANSADVWELEKFSKECYFFYQNWIAEKLHVYSGSSQN